MSFSRSLAGLEESAQFTALSPRIGQSSNNSDMDLIEFEGDTYIFWAESDQSSWAKVYKATFGDTNKEFLKALRKGAKLEN